MSVVINGTTGISGVDGSAGTPAVQGTDNNTGEFFPAADTIAWATGGTERMRVNSSGNVGINTTSPTGKTHIAGASVDAGLSNVLSLTQGGSGTGTAAELRIGASATAYYSNIVSAYSSPGSYLYFGTSADNTNPPTERARIDSSGNLLVGTTSGAGKLRVKGGNDNTFILDNDGSQYTAMYMANNGTAKTQFFWDNTAARTYVVSVTNGVYLASGGTSWTAVSDERKKDIIEPISDAANKVSQLRAVIGKYKTDEEGTRRSFLIAQDVQAIFPEAVDSNNPDELGLSYTDTIPLLVAAIKELKAEVDSLKAQLEAK